jgi:hypothetical protein
MVFIETRGGVPECQTGDSLVRGALGYYS